MVHNEKLFKKSNVIWSFPLMQLAKTKSRPELSTNCSIQCKNCEISGPYYFWTPIKSYNADVWNWNCWTCWTLFGLEIDMCLCVCECVCVYVHEPSCGDIHTISSICCGNRDGCGNQNFGPQLKSLKLKELLINTLKSSFKGWPTKLVFFKCICQFIYIMGTCVSRTTLVLKTTIHSYAFFFFFYVSFKSKLTKIVLIMQ